MRLDGLEAVVELLGEGFRITRGAAQDFFDQVKCRDLWAQMVRGPDRRLGKALVKACPAEN